MMLILTMLLNCMTGYVVIRSLGRKASAIAMTCFTTTLHKMVFIVLLLL